jgi:uncharacterized protein (DUF2336 family)
MSFDPVKIVNADTLEKIVLTRQISGFLLRSENDEKRETIVNVACALAQDVILQVREALAFELRNCLFLPHDLAARIASDVESVSGPFLAATTVFSDQQLAGLIPHLEDYAHVTIAKRKDLGPAACEAIVTFGSEKSVCYLVRNETTPLTEALLRSVILRFPDRRNLMDHLSQRANLPISIVAFLMDKVSDKFRCLLEGLYDLSGDVADSLVRTSISTAIWQVIVKSDRSQIHAYVGELKDQQRLTIELALEMARKGSFAFLESAIAYWSGLTLSAAKHMMRSSDSKMFVALMRQADIPKVHAHSILELLNAQEKNSHSQS